jgi:hypothetical protein
MWSIQLAFHRCSVRRTLLASLGFSKTYSSQYGSNSSPSISNAAFQNLPDITDLLPKVSKLQHHRMLYSKYSTYVTSFFLKCRSNLLLERISFLLDAFFVWKSWIKFHVRIIRIPISELQQGRENSVSVNKNCIPGTHSRLQWRKGLHKTQHKLLYFVCVCVCARAFVCVRARARSCVWLTLGLKLVHHKVRRLHIARKNSQY